jgi:hypothetical protein
VDVPAEAAARPLNDSWPVDIPVEVAGRTVRFETARLATFRGQLALQLTSAPLPTEGDQWLAGLQLGAITGPSGQRLDRSAAFIHVGAGWYERSQDHVAGLVFIINDPATGQVQPGLYQVTFDGLRIGVRGPWTLTWQLPGP